MFRRRFWLLSVLPVFFSLFIVYFSPEARASIFGTVRGIVHDTQHRPIEGAKIELRAKLSDWQRSAVSDGDGGFQIDAVPAGAYVLLISHDGFRSAEVGLVVAADAAPIRHFPLELATINKQIEVQADAVNIDPSSSNS